MKSEGNFLNKR